MWIKFTNENKCEDIIKSLDELGFSNSEFSVDRDKAVALCTFISREWKQMYYILLNEWMCGENEHITWIMNREEVKDKEELINKIKVLI